MIIDTGYLYSIDGSRLFINTSLGCGGSCSYCYLPKIGYSNIGLNNKAKSAKLLIEDIKNIKEITPKTLISLGCYSECFDEANIRETKKIIKYFLSNNYQVQLSTKKYIKPDYIRELNKYIKYKGQLIIFVSFATISNHDTYEKKTDEPNLRVKNFNIKKKYNILVVLYIKPVLENITIKDIDIFEDIIKKYSIENVVVGSIFNNKKGGQKVEFSDNLYYFSNNDENKIIERLSNISNVYNRSTEVVKKYNKRYL